MKRHLEEGGLAQLECEIAEYFAKHAEAEKEMMEDFRFADADAWLAEPVDCDAQENQL